MSGATAARSRGHSPVSEGPDATISSGPAYHGRLNATMRRFLPILSITLVAGLMLLAAGCGHSFMGGGVSEGEIEYKMTFPDMDPDGLMADMLPEKTVLSFNRENQSLDLSAGMGVFRTSMVVNTMKKVVDYHMSVMGKNLVAALRQHDLMNLSKTPPNIAVLFTDARDTIAGYPCKQAYLIYEDIAIPEAEVWYTDAISMETPNWYGPYSEIPGVLMRYELVQHKIRMRLEATSVKPGPVDADKFILRPDHQEVSPQVLYQQLDEVLGSFSN